jgi:hypothetical protein
MSDRAGFCSCCDTHTSLEHHHKFGQHGWRRKLYGKLLDDARNIQWACSGCHASHRSTKLVHWTEAEFCAALGIQPRSKVARGVG